jgi:hypothetical protein
MARLTTPETNLVTIARMLGEPGPFTLDDLATETGMGARGLALSLSGPVRAGFIHRDTGTYALTDAGFDEAMRLSGGLGLL